jgi:hypothetical protein
MEDILSVKRILSVFHTAVMLLGILPFSVFTADNDPGFAQWGEGEIVVAPLASGFECPPGAARVERKVFNFAVPT